MTDSASSLSPADADALPEETRRRTPLRRIRLSTLLLLIVVAALVIGLYVQRRRETQLLADLSIYREPIQEGIFDALDEPIALTYADGAPLDVVLKEIEQKTTKTPKLPKLPTGIPIYVDPLGLQEAEKSLNSEVKRPPSADRLTLGEHLKGILDPLGLAYTTKDGFLMITSGTPWDMTTSVPSEHRPIVDLSRDEIYLKYRDVLK
jgi:hypothetical protein